MLKNNSFFLGILISKDEFLIISRNANYIPGSEAPSERVYNSQKQNSNKANIYYKKIIKGVFKYG